VTAKTKAKMKIIKPSVEILDQSPGLEGIYKQIEVAGRACYASSHRIGENTAKPFVDGLIKSGHGAMLEHGAVYLQMPYSRIAYDAFDKNPYSKVDAIEETNSLFVSTNYRVIIENHLEDLLKYLVEPGPMHELRVTARFQCQIAISREYNRHRKDSIAEQSTRYCNYSADKFGNEITVNLPTWIEQERLPKINDNLEALKTYCKYIDGSLFAPGAKMEPIDYWLFANLACEYSYMKLIECGWKPQQARTILPLDTNTDLVHTAFISDWQHFFSLRCDKAHAHPDAYYLASELERLFEEHGYHYELQGF